MRLAIEYEGERVERQQVLDVQRSYEHGELVRFGAGIKAGNTRPDDTSSDGRYPRTEHLIAARRASWLKPPRWVRYAD